MRKLNFILFIVFANTYCICKAFNRKTEVKLGINTLKTENMEEKNK